MANTYALPDLRYDYGALAPHISARLLELHHSKHHAAYVKGANETAEKLVAARAASDFTSINALQKLQAFHVSGHVLHSVFWDSMAPSGVNDPEGALAEAINSAFGSYEALQQQMNACVVQLQGSGWATLAWEPVAATLVVEQVYDHQSNVALGSAPLFVIDGWEHAYYLDYVNEKPKFLAAFWEIADWEAAVAGFDALVR